MKHKNTRAFSLLEIVIAMLILSVVVSGLFGLFITSHKFIGEAGHRLQAIQYARQAAEILKVYVSADPKTPLNAGTAFTAGAHADLAPIGSSNSINLQGITYNRSYDVAYPYGEHGPRQVAVNVNWKEP